MNNLVIVSTTVSKKDDARKIAREILEQRLAACVQISTAIQSLYWWKNSIVRDEEHILSMKTTVSIYPRLEEKLKKIHPYETPEIYSVQATAVHPDYQKWVDEELKLS